MELLLLLNLLLSLLGPAPSMACPPAGLDLEGGLLEGRICHLHHFSSPAPTSRHFLYRYRTIHGLGIPLELRNASPSLTTLKGLDLGGCCLLSPTAIHPLLLWLGFLKFRLDTTLGEPHPCTGLDFHRSFHLGPGAFGSHLWQMTPCPPDKTGCVDIKQGDPHTVEDLVPLVVWRHTRTPVQHQTKKLRRVLACFEQRWFPTETWPQTWILHPCCRRIRSGEAPSCRMPCRREPRVSPPGIVAVPCEPQLELSSTNKVASHNRLDPNYLVNVAC